MISGYWKDTGNVTDMLEVNRMVLESVEPLQRGTVDQASELIGRVVIEDGAQVTGSRIVGPVIIGAGSEVTDSYIGPFTSIAQGCAIADSEIEYSIVLRGASIHGVRRIEASLIGHDVEVTRAPKVPKAHRLVLGDHSRVQISSSTGGRRASGGAPMARHQKGSRHHEPMASHRSRGDARPGPRHRLDRRGEAVTGLARRDLDVTERTAVSAALRRHRPDVVVNCAAWTAVDDAETSEEQALLTNGNGPANLASSCGAAGARLVQVSTDYVFDGVTARPYAEGDAPAPRSAYGRTKLAGEQAVLALVPDLGYVVRTSWLYGAHGPNFVRTMIRLERQRPDVDVVDDQRGQPTWTVDVADRIIALLRSGARQASTMPPVRARPPGSGSPARCSASSEPIRAGSGRRRPRRWPVLRRAPPTASWATTAGPVSASRRWMNGSDLGRAFPALAATEPGG